jgi:hypothetical protein
MTAAAPLVARAARLAEIRSTGLVRQASEQTKGSVEQTLPLSAALRPLFPQGGLRRGSTISVLSGSTTLLFTLLAEASSAGSWCAVVGLPRLGLVAAAEAGLALERLALVPAPGPDWASVVAALVEGVDVVVLATPGGVSAQLGGRLTARARQRGAVLVSIGRWPGADLVLEATDTTWHGLGQGRGRLRSREMDVTAHGRGAATRTRRVRLRFAAPSSVSTRPRVDVTARPDVMRPDVTRPDATRPELVALSSAVVPLSLAG